MMFENIQFETPRLIIRPYQLQDLDDLYTLACDATVYHYIPEGPFSKSDIEVIIKWSMDCMLKNTKEKVYKMNMAIINKENNQFIGYCGLGPDDLNENSNEIYYALNKDYWGRGLATEAIQEIIKFAFKDLELEKLIAVVHPDNSSSINLIQKMGMKHTRILKELPKEDHRFEGYHIYELMN
jgi:[ribosomal protein S5]-alanine N-acetyltransferase